MPKRPRVSLRAPRHPPPAPDRAPESRDEHARAPARRKTKRPRSEKRGREFDATLDQGEPCEPFIMFGFVLLSLRFLIVSPERLLCAIIASFLSKLNSGSFSP